MDCRVDNNREASLLLSVSDRSVFKELVWFCLHLSEVNCTSGGVSLSAVFDFNSVEVKNTLPVDLLVVSELNAQSFSNLESVDEDSAAPVINIVALNLDVSVEFGDGGSHIEALNNSITIGVFEGALNSVSLSGSVMPVLEVGGEGDGVSSDRLDNCAIEFVGLGA